MALKRAAIAAAGGSPGAALQFVDMELGKVRQAMDAILARGDPDFQLRGTLASPHKLVLQLDAKSDQGLGKTPGAIDAALGLLQQAPPVLDEVNAGVKKLLRFLDKVRFLAMV